MRLFLVHVQDLADLHVRLDAGQVANRPLDRLDRKLLRGLWVLARARNLQDDHGSDSHFALRIAKEWGDLSEVPVFHMLKEPGRLATYVDGDHFAAIYGACHKATLPSGQPYLPADWWRGLLTMAYMTGWRIGDLLALNRDDVDLEKGFAISRAENNKGKRDEKLQLHSVVIEHLKRLAGFAPLMFPWPYNLRRLYAEFARIQEAAGIHLPCTKKHKHTRFCHVYGFHDFRRAFATMNADKLSADALQSLMRHKSYTTTQKYINLARQMDKAVASLHVPEILKAANGG